jgi:hypothetical protein
MCCVRCANLDRWIGSTTLVAGNLAAVANGSRHRIIAQPTGARDEAAADTSDLCRLACFRLFLFDHGASVQLSVP